MIEEQHGNGGRDTARMRRRRENGNRRNGRQRTNELNRHHSSLHFTSLSLLSHPLIDGQLTTCDQSNSRNRVSTSIDDVTCRSGRRDESTPSPLLLLSILRCSSSSPPPLLRLPLTPSLSMSICTLHTLTAPACTSVDRARGRVRRRLSSSQRPSSLTLSLSHPHSFIPFSSLAVAAAKHTPSRSNAHDTQHNTQQSNDGRQLPLHTLHFTLRFSSLLSFITPTLPFS